MLPFRGMGRTKESRLYLVRTRLDAGFRHVDMSYEREVRRFAGRRWIDLGCGSNGLVREQRGRHPLAVGVDADPAYLQRGLGPDLLGDISALPFQDGAFGLATSYMVVEHLTDPQAFRRELLRILAPDGAFVFATVNRGYWGSRMNRILPEAWKNRLLGLLFHRDERDIFPAPYLLNGAAEFQELLGGDFDLEIRRFHEYYGFSTLFFWLQRAVHRLVGDRGFMESNILVIGHRRSPGPG